MTKSKNSKNARKGQKINFGEKEFDLDRDFSYTHPTNHHQLPGNSKTKRATAIPALPFSSAH
jgi:hypothetical protein